MSLTLRKNIPICKCGVTLVKSNYFHENLTRDADADRKETFARWNINFRDCMKKKLAFSDYCDKVKLMRKRCTPVARQVVSIFARDE
jgi:hypothetical protein